MALRDVKDYYSKMFLQYLEMKNDLADFEQALKDGYITEDQLEELKAEFNNIEINYHRLSYIMYLLELPNRKSKQPRYKKANSKLESYFSQTNSTAKDVELENEGALNELRKQVKKLAKISKIEN